MSLAKSQMTECAELNLLEIRRILRRHKGAMAEIARNLGVSITSVSMVVGRPKRPSKRILDAARAKALQLLEQEKVEAGAA